MERIGRRSCTTRLIETGETLNTRIIAESSHGTSLKEITTMTERERYDIILQELAEVINSKNGEISILRWQVSNLEAKLKKLEGNGNDAE